MPAGVDALVEIVNVEEPPAVTDEGANPALAPDGNPLADNDTDCAEPLVTEVETDEVPDWPCATDTLDGLAPIEKSLDAGALTVSEMVVECVALEPVPVIVTE